MRSTEKREPSFLVSMREFLRDPSMVGSGFPATDRMVRRLLDRISWDQIRVMVEFGPGTGKFTQAALQRLPASGVLIAIDTSPSFTALLREKTNDPRLKVVTGSAERVQEILGGHGFTRADCIVSGLPVSTLEPEIAERLMDQSARSLSPQGVFAAYQMRRAIEPLLRQRFRTVEKRYEWWNIPPCHLYWALRPIAR